MGVFIFSGKKHPKKLYPLKKGFRGLETIWEMRYFA
jgi:hypothetical protein